MALADVDMDGDLDLYLTNYKTVMAKDIYSPFERSFHQIVSEDEENPTIREKFIDHYTIETRGKQIVVLEMAEEDAMLLNNGQGLFVQEAVSGRRFSFDQATPDLRDWGLMARFQDIDLDGDPDLYVCNDFESPDRFYINDGTGNFHHTSPLSVRSTSNSSMAVDFTDLERDGDIDFFIADMLSIRHDRRKTQMGTMVPTPLAIGAIENRPQYMRNTLFLNRGDVTYAEVAQYAGLQASEWTWSVQFLDIDLDGYEDILATTGHAFDVMDSDTDVMIRSRTRAGMIDFTKSTMFLYPSLNTQNFSFRNQGDLHFKDMSQPWGFSSVDISHSMALGDLDNDGDLDVVINRLESEAGVYRNDSNAPRIAVRLRGDSPNTQGIGSKVRLLGGPVDQMKEVISGGSYLSGSEALVTFASWDTDREFTLEVTWRSGEVSVIEGVKGNRLYEVYENYPFLEENSEINRHPSTRVKVASAFSGQ